MPNDTTVNSIPLRTPTFSMLTDSAWTKERLAKHVFFWLVLLLWISALAQSKAGLSNFNALLLLNLVRLPLILVLTYGTVQYLFPNYFLREGWKAFALRFIPALIIFSLLDRLVCGSSLSGWATSGSGLKWVFFNWIPILRNTFVVLAITGLMAALKWGRLLLPKQHPTQLMPLTQMALTPAASEEILSVKSGKEQIFLPITEIIRLERDENYVVIYSTTGRTLVRSSLRSIAAQLPDDQFVRIHRSHLVATRQVTRVAASTIIQQDGTSLPVSRTCRQAVNALV
jgi:hypothetical protein